MNTVEITYIDILAADAVDMHSDATADIVIVGDLGGSISVTGDIYRSSATPGTIVFETEIGTLRIADDQRITVRYGV